MKHQPFSIYIDGPNDTGIEKINPITVRIYNMRSGKIINFFLDIGETTSDTAEAVYITLNEKIS